MRVLLVAEGRNELAGAIETLVRRLGLGDAEIVQDWANRRSLHAHHGKGKGFLKRAQQWMKFALRHEFDVLVMVIDQDKRPESVREFDTAQDDPQFAIRRALGVAIRTFDAWMLADEKALSQVLACQVNRRPSPEETPDPKRCCDQLCAGSNAPLGRSEVYAALAAVVNVGVVESRCPKGFAPFAQRVRELSSSRR